MIKMYKRTLILSTLVMLIPVLVGLLLWNQLPDPMPSHWNINGEVDGWSSKAFSVFGFPALLIAIHWLCVFLSTTDPHHRNYHPKMIKLMFCICPGISLMLCTMVYGAALGYSIPIETVMPLLVGAMFVVIGNLMPKCRRSYTMGIKLPWTLNSEANWNATHRFGGKVWVIGGILTMLSAIIGNFWILMGILAAMVIIPTVYSYRYYCKHEKEDAHGN